MGATTYGYRVAVRWEDDASINPCIKHSWDQAWRAWRSLGRETTDLLLPPHLGRQLAAQRGQGQGHENELLPTWSTWGLVLRIGPEPHQDPRQRGLGQRKAAWGSLGLQVAESRF